MKNNFVLSEFVWTNFLTSISFRRARVAKALGATVVSNSSIVKGNPSNMPDAIIVDSISFPPHSTAIHYRISKILNAAPNNIPIIDLSWVVQSIVQRQRLSFDDDERYRVNPFDYQTSSKAYLIKVKSEGNLSVRYEVGDTVKIRERSSKQGTYARIMGIRVEKGKQNVLQVQLLVS